MENNMWPMRGTLFERDRIAAHLTYHYAMAPGKAFIEALGKKQSAELVKE